MQEITYCFVLFFFFPAQRLLINPGRAVNESDFRPLLYVNAVDCSLKDRLS